MSFAFRVGTGFDVHALVPGRRLVVGSGGARRGAVLARRAIAPAQVNGVIVHATTVVTNSLIERKGAPTGLIATEGFRDTLEMRREHKYELYNLFIHGVISRRAFMDELKKFAVGGLAVATLLELLMPQYAAAQQVAKNDERIKASYVTIPSPNGNGSIKAYLVRPDSADTRNEKPSKIAGVFVVHENRGLNPHIEDVARRFALQGFMALAPDALTSVGGFPGDDYRGGVAFSKMDQKKLADKFLNNPKTIEVARPATTNTNIKQTWCTMVSKLSKVSSLTPPKGQPSFFSSNVISSTLRLGANSNGTPKASPAA